MKPNTNILRAKWRCNKPKVYKLHKYVLPFIIKDILAFRITWIVKVKYTYQLTFSCSCRIFPIASWFDPTMVHKEITKHERDLIVQRYWSGEGHKIIYVALDEHSKANRQQLDKMMAQQWLMAEQCPSKLVRRQRENWVGRWLSYDKEWPRKQKINILKWPSQSPESNKKYVGWLKEGCALKISSQFDKCRKCFARKSW